MIRIHDEETTGMTTQELVKKAEELGYTVTHLVHRDYGTSFGIVPTSREEYTAEIFDYKDFAIWEQIGPKGANHWKVQTTSYGALNPTEIDKVIKGLQNGQQMAKILNGINLANLEEYRLQE